MAPPSAVYAYSAPRPLSVVQWPGINYSRKHCALAKSIADIIDDMSRICCVPRFLFSMALVGACFSPSSEAASFVEIELRGEPQAFVEAGKTTGCGLRVVGSELPGAQTEPFRLLDASVVVYPEGWGLVKISSSYGSIENGKLKREDRIVTGGWFKAGTADATTAFDGRFAKSTESPKSILYPAKLALTAGVIGAALQNKPIQIAIETADDRNLRTYFGVVTLTEGEKAQISQCIAEISSSK